MAIWTSNYKSEPAGTQTFSVTDDELRGLKAKIEATMFREIELEFGVDSATGKIGLARSGSAKVYHQASAPTVRPDGTAFDDTDLGRLYYRTAYAAADANLLGDGRFGMYHLIKVGSNYRWKPMDGNAPIGTVEQFDEVAGSWTDPTATTGWYDTGTRPGWIKLEGGSYTRPQGAFTVPDYQGKFAKGKDTANAEAAGTSGGDDEVTLAKANLPPHGHDIANNAVSVTVNSGGAHDHDIHRVDYIGSGSVKGFVADIINNADIADETTSVDSAGAHTHSVTVTATATAVTDESNVAFANDPVALPLPPFRVLTFIMRVY